MKRIYEELGKLKPTYEEIEKYAEEYGDYGVVTYTKRDDNPLIIRLHDTWGMKYQGRLHIDIISGEFHLMLDKHHTPEFLAFIKEKRREKNG